MPRMPSSLSRAHWYTFSRNPAPRVLVTSKTAPSTRSVSQSNGSAFLGVHRRLNLSAALTRKLSKTNHQPPINAEINADFGRNRGTRPVQLIPGRCTSHRLSLTPTTAPPVLGDLPRSSSV